MPEAVSVPVGRKPAKVLEAASEAARTAVVVNFMSFPSRNRMVG
jgi:hypothetical protein